MQNGDMSPQALRPDAASRAPCAGRLPCPTTKGACQATRRGVAQHARDRTKAISGDSQVEHRQVAPSVVQHRSVGSTAVEQLSLQSPDTYLQQLGDLLLSGLAVREPRSEELTYADLDAADFGLGKIAERYGVVMLGELCVAGFKWALNAFRSKHHSRLWRAEGQGCSQNSVEVIDSFWSRPAQLNAQRGEVSSDERAAHPQVRCNQAID
jgi:hypothetical protein